MGWIRVRFLQLDKNMNNYLIFRVDLLALIMPMKSIGFISSGSINTKKGVQKFLLPRKTPAT